MTDAAPGSILLEILVEELSAERALNVLIPMNAPGVRFAVRPHRGKHELLRKLPGRLRGYRNWSVETRIVVLVDRDQDDCVDLKRQLETLAVEAGRPTLTSVAGQEVPRVATRIAIEELEAWFFGDVDALASAYPGVPRSLASRASFRDPDAIVGAWERLELVLKRAGHHRAGLNKVQAASDISEHMDVDSNRSTSFCCFRDGIRRLTDSEVSP